MPACERLPIVVISHHPETCGGRLMAHLRAQAPVQMVRPLCGQPLPSLERVAGIVVLGSHHSVNRSFPMLNEERRWLRQALLLPKLGRNMPILGICFGAQLIAQIAGAQIFQGASPEIGAHRVTPAQGQDWLTEAMEVMGWHQEGIGSVPEGGKLVARGNEAFPVQAFQWRQALALQFHPETTPAMVQRWAALHGANEAALQLQLARLEPMRKWLDNTLHQLFAPTTAVTPSAEPAEA